MLLPKDACAQHVSRIGHPAFSPKFVFLDTASEPQRRSCTPRDFHSARRGCATKEFINARSGGGVATQICVFLFCCACMAVEPQIYIYICILISCNGSRKNLRDKHANTERDVQKHASMHRSNNTKNTRRHAMAMGVRLGRTFLAERQGELGCKRLG